MAILIKTDGTVITFDYMIDAKPDSSAATNEQHFNFVSGRDPYNRFVATNVPQSHIHKIIQEEMMDNKGCSPTYLGEELLARGDTGHATVTDTKFETGGLV
jgi:hypothetical protein